MGSELEKCGSILGLVILMPNLRSGDLHDLDSFIVCNWFSTRVVVRCKT